jgi:Xaa-Pro aminopeptidase
VDDLTRSVLRAAGYDSYFLHRSGHSMGTEIHASGVNMDNLETRDSRTIIPRTCFVIEPAVYFSEYGMRTEINVYIDQKGAHVFSRSVQDQIIPILK